MVLPLVLNPSSEEEFRATWFQIIAERNRVPSPRVAVSGHLAAHAAGRYVQI
jgi:hypothetical protein